MSKSIAVAYSMKKKKKGKTATEYVEDLEAKQARSREKKDGKVQSVIKYPEPGENTKKKMGPGYSSGGCVDSGDSTMNYAEGGEVDDGGAPAWVCSKCGEHGNTFKGYQDGSKALDMISKILDKRKMSKGGQVANDTDFTADTLPNEFDDLVLRDDEEMEGYTAKNSGDEIGGPSKDDAVSRAMLKRKAKKKA